MTDALHDLLDHPLWQHAADALFVVDEGGTVLAANGPFERLFGFEPGDATGVVVESLVPEKYRAGHRELREGFADAPVARTMGASRLLEGVTTSGTTFPINISLSPFEIDGGAVTLAAVRDLSDRMAVEAERASADRRRIVAEDHDRIARELHDTVIQHLFAIGLRLQGLPARINDESVSRAIDESVDAIDSVIAQVRSSIHGLRVPSDGAVRRMQIRVLEVVGEMNELLPNAPSVRFEGEVQGSVDSAVVNDLIPALREAVSNAGRHAEAETVLVVVTIGDTIGFEVSDDGVGIPANVHRSGLANLEARARALGGSMTTRSNSPSGTIVNWQVPRN